MNNNLNEIPILLCCLRCGIMIGILYDILRVPRHIRGWLPTAICDTLFGIAACGMTALTLIYCDNGNLRLFSLMGIACGAIIWEMLPGKLLRSCIGRVLLHFRKKRGS